MDSLVFGVSFPFPLCSSQTETSEPCETRSRHSVSTNTLLLAGDKHLVARLCCRATLHSLFFSLSFNAFTFVFGSSQATPSVLLLPSHIMQCIPQRPHNIHST